METVRLRTIVPKSHRIEIDLPPQVPEGPADVLVIVETPPAHADGDKKKNLLLLLDDLQAFREQFRGRDIRLSDAVIEERREDRS